jgi:hypothetical protein
MPNDLYDRDVLAWSEHQADLLRRLARGEQVNDRRPAARVPYLLVSSTASA